MASTSIDAAYTALPQAPDPAFAGHPVVTTSLSVNEEGDEDQENQYGTVVENFALDPRIRWMLFALGAAVLLPWNVMITATPYFLSRLTPALSGTFSSYLSLVMNVGNLFFLAHATISAKQATESMRTRLTLLCLAALVFILFTSTYSRPAPGVFFAFVLLNAAAQAAAGSYLNTSVVAVSSLFGPIAMQSVMSGQAAVGVIISGVQVLSAAGSIHGAPDALAKQADDDAAAQSAFVFFGLSTVFLFVTAGAHAWLIRLPEYKAVIKPHGEHSRDPSRRLSIDSPVRRLSLSIPSSPDTMRGLVSGMEKGRIMRVAKANAVYEFALAYVFIVTLAVFPPITVSVRPTNPSTHPLLFSALHFLIFNIGDFLGRLLCSFPSLLIWSGPRVLSLSLLRTLFIPLFLACNVQRPNAGSTAAPPLFNSDVVFMVLLIAFGLTNGYVSTLCMMAAPSVEHNPRLKGRRDDIDTAATVANFCLIGGLACGSIASFAVRGAVCGCNPFRE